ncbi:MAG: GTPase ObgE [uncultured bacterium]|nr:MAG: GTPase ObgE [uncultured bacterium]
MLIDDITIKVSAGKGGKGSVSFNKNLMELGPAGGSGGKGGSVFAEGVTDLGALNQFRYKKEIYASDGKDGRGQFRDGSDGEDLILKLPVGTVIQDSTKGTVQEITKSGEKILIAQGGKGGKGNFLFRSAKNTSPEQFQEGLAGEETQLHLELKMIADIGFVGLPNVGKSSLLNELTNAQSKVANYRFTTLEPNLGVYYGLILADIPGLIEGASEGKGLGIKFLKHIERTETIFHFISADSENPVQDYEIIRKELEAHNPKLLEKEEYLFLSKSDLLSKEELEEKIKQLQKINPVITAISIIDEESLEKVRKLLNKITLISN